VSFLDRILGRDRDPKPDETAQAPSGDVDPHEAEADESLRSEVRGEEYRKADPRDIVESEGTLMAGPGGAPQDSGPADHPDAPGLEDPEEQEQPGQ
jgi:hypothetical protein